MTHNVGIYLYNEVEVLDFAGPFEVFSTASRVNARIETESNNLFHVFTVAENMNPLFARGGLQIVPEHSMSDHPDINLLIIPGGIITDELEKEHVVSWVFNSSKNSIITGSVCTGAFLLAKAGLLTT